MLIKNELSEWTSHGLNRIVMRFCVRNDHTLTKFMTIFYILHNLKNENIFSVFFLILKVLIFACFIKKYSKSLCCYIFSSSYGIRLVVVIEKKTDYYYV